MGHTDEFWAKQSQLTYGAQGWMEDLAAAPPAFSVQGKVGTHSQAVVVIKGRERSLTIGDLVEFHYETEQKWRSGRVWNIQRPFNSPDRPGPPLYCIELF